MQRINVSEKDLTTSTRTQYLQDRVFVPGFAVNKESEDLVGLAVDCDSLEDFYSIFRGAVDTASGNYFEPVFKDNQAYPVYSYTEGVYTAGFQANAIPASTDSSGDDNGNMFVANEIDPSYNYAVKLLSAGMPVTYVRMNTYSYRWIADATATTGFSRQFDDDYDVTVMNAYKKMSTEVFDYTTTDEAPTYKSPIMSVGDVDIKFITSGGYPVFEYNTASSEGTNSIMKQMMYIAKSRGDCVALIDHTDNSSRALVGDTSVFNQINSQLGTEWLSLLPFGSMFTPYLTTSDGSTTPPSLAYLTAMSSSNIYTKNWLAIAGVNRGIVSCSTTHTNKKLTNTIAEYYQRENSDATSISINPITYIKSAGYCIWGNRTLTKAATTTQGGFATMFLNLRNLVSDVKKQARQSAQNCLFEQNTDVLWVNFKEGITPLLDQMVTGSALKGYKIIKQETSDKQKISADIRIYPIYSVESFDITITITDDDEVTTEE